MNVPCATSHSNASKLDAVFVDQCFVLCLLAWREEKRRVSRREERRKKRKRKNKSKSKSKRRSKRKRKRKRREKKKDKREKEMEREEEGERTREKERERVCQASPHTRTTTTQQHTHHHTPDNRPWSWECLRQEKSECLDTCTAGNRPWSCQCHFFIYNCNNCNVCNVCNVCNFDADLLCSIQFKSVMSVLWCRAYCFRFYFLLVTVIILGGMVLECWFEQKFVRFIERFHEIHIVERKTSHRKKSGPVRDWQNFRRPHDQIMCGPKYGPKFGKAAQNREEQEWAIENPNWIMLDNWEESVSLIWKIRRPWKMQEKKKAGDTHGTGYALYKKEQR